MSDQTSRPSTPDYFNARYMFPRPANGQDHSGLTHDRSTQTDYNDDIGGYASRAHTATSAGDPSESVAVNRSSRASSKTISAASTPSELPTTARGPHFPCDEPTCSIHTGRSESEGTMSHCQDGFLNAEYIFNPTFSQLEDQSSSTDSRTASQPISPFTTDDSASDHLSTTSDAGGLAPGADVPPASRPTNIKKERRKTGLEARSIEETLAYLKRRLEIEEETRTS